MSRRQWFLDAPIQAGLFEKNWSDESTSELIKLFKIADESSSPLLSMLPDGVSAAGVAAAAALMFVPGTQKPPEAPCRIAVFPGFHFTRGLKKVAFNPSRLYRTTQIFRTMGHSTSQISDPMIRFQKNQKDLEAVHFHWLWRCRRVWSVYGVKESQDIEPREYYGRNDPYDALIDVLETDEIDRFSSRYEPYDLLIFCPSFLSRGIDLDEVKARQMFERLGSFNAHRKMFIARSPYDYWAKRLESEFSLRGVSTTKRNQMPRPGPQLRCEVVNQFVSIAEAQELYDSIRIAAGLPDAERQLIAELRSILRRILVSIEPNVGYDDSLEEIALRMRGIARALELQAPGMLIVDSILDRVLHGGADTKAESLKKLLANDNLAEIWVTKDSDRRAIENINALNDFKNSVVLADRWITPGNRVQASSGVILTRIDRETDLDLVAYLGIGDIVLISSWELVVRAASIDSAWERSERWREESKRLKLISEDEVPFDPVLWLADFMGKAVPKVLRDKTSAKVNLEPDQPWWDADDERSLLSNDFSRDDALSDEAESVKCLELRLEGGYGIFLRLGSEVQVVCDSDDEDDFSLCPIEELEVEQTLILFRDGERASIFDILMDALERSESLADDAKIVRNWKLAVRMAYVRDPPEFSALAKKFHEAGRIITDQSVRGWIIGPTMAPQKLENIELLTKVLELQAIDPSKVFESVRNVRRIARILGRVLNHWIVHRELNSIEPRLKETISASGIDLEELAGAVEAHTISEISSQIAMVNPTKVKRLFRL